MKSGDDSRFAVGHSGNHLEQNLAGELFGAVHIVAFETDDPNLRVQIGEFQSSHISIGNGFADGFDDCLAGIFEIVNGEFFPGLFRKQRDKSLGIIFNKSLLSNRVILSVRQFPVLVLIRACFGLVFFAFEVSDMNTHLITTTKLCYAEYFG